MRRLAAADAQMYWMSRSIPSDQFLMYAFGDRTGDLEQALDTLRDRAHACPDLRLRITDTGFWTYPVWTQRQVGRDQIVVHELADASWGNCLEAVAALVDDQLDARVATWRLHVFPAVDGVPGCGRAGAVAVVQICHAVADGIRSSALAAYLFGRDADLPAPAPIRRSEVWSLPTRGIGAARAYRRLVRDTDAGLVPHQAHSRPALRINACPAGARYLRMVVSERRRIGGPTVTVGVLSAISGALSAHLRALGEDPSLLAAEVPMARTGPRRAYNHFGNVGVGLYPDEESERRAPAIAAELHQRRRRSVHPAMAADAAASASVPAPLLRWGVGKLDPKVRWETVTGNTVVSSVNRGARDLWFGEGRVVWTAGPPALSPMMGLTHGVHGIGDTVVLSVHAAESAIGDIDSYVERLEWELA